ncbi:hypothetical protein HY68_35650 [Streptomyces sp. AcH 505]|uniref:hypothetical protein n=1 Tax=Streptomyces sp. AcH 505 TaxID=352211 RepID=UPI000591EDF8|nr:hypothetical protein HY68_35650 [Streptomyces sp. AcH 505]
MPMPRNTCRNSFAVLALVMLPVLTSCGGSADEAGPNHTADQATSTVDAATNGAAGADDATKKTYIMENSIAACMKKQGFTYTPRTGPATGTETASDQAASAMDGEDYALSKKWRQKYGFGTYAAAAYPDDPEAPSAGGQTRQVFHGSDDEAGLTAAQRAAFETALEGPPAKGAAGDKVAAEKPGGCRARGMGAAYGKPLSADAEKKAWAAKEDANRSNGLELNGDAQLVQLAQQYATCLKAQGIPVSTTQPTGMATMVRLDLTKELPEKHSLSREEALPLLTKDIDTALKDLECGKDFRAAYFPKEKAHPYWGDGA